jgi:hypothetical protein
VSGICEAFGCAPDVAERQNWQTVKAILEYRAAKAAVDMVNQGNSGMEELAKHPSLGNLLVEMHRAQGTETTVEAIMADMQGRGDSHGE